MLTLHSRREHATRGVAQIATLDAQLFPQEFDRLLSACVGRQRPEANDFLFEIVPPSNSRLEAFSFAIATRFGKMAA
jgi:hypothetical protein